MLAVMYGLAAAVGYGASDFLAGLGARRAPTLAVVLIAQLVGGVLLLGVAWAVGHGADGKTVTWGVAAGVVLGFGSLAFYRGLAVGSMGVVAAVMGIGQALVPFLVGVTVHGRLSNMAGFGALLGLVAIALVVTNPANDAEAANTPLRTGGIVEGALAGLLFGLFFVFLDQADDGGPLLPSASAMLAGAATVLLLGWTLRQQIVPSREALPSILGVGVCSALATLCFVLGVREGHLSIVSVVEGLSPAVTAVCAFCFAAERLSRRQRAGFAVAMAGVMLMAAG
jgi:drug/metabolite transporter (DMT)-like permease